MDYILIAPPGRGLEKVSFKGTEAIVFDLSQGQKGLSKLLLSRMQGGQKKFVFFADEKAKKETVARKVPLWLRDIREKALDCDFHYAGIFYSRGNKNSRKEKRAGRKM